MEINIRKATPRDYQKLLILFEEVDKLHREQHPHVFKKPQKPSRSRDFLFKQEDAVIFVAETEKKEPVGLIHIFIKTSKPIPILVKRRYALIDTLVVSKKHRRLGIGKKLADQADEWIKSQGIKQVELSVYQFNRPAINFYRKRGYKVTSYKMEENLN